MLVVDPSGRALRRIAVDRLATLNQPGSTDEVTV